MAKPERSPRERRAAAFAAGYRQALADVETVGWSAGSAAALAYVRDNLSQAPACAQRKVGK